MDCGISIRGRFGLEGPSCPSLRAAGRGDAGGGSDAAALADEEAGDGVCCHEESMRSRCRASNQAVGVVCTSGASVGILGVAAGSRRRLSVVSGLGEWSET